MSCVVGECNFLECEYNASGYCCNDYIELDNTGQCNSWELSEKGGAR